ncbi:protein amalgam-like [Portunus trituberculatus]|uniref:protein amalgam-like n=1 Tax=Portunus trituberculatus TaxID=210409 RepID=UPI001E1CB09F|nr:protein amalgam-like [Portunus trituberculatus]
MLRLFSKFVFLLALLVTAHSKPSTEETGRTEEEEEKEEEEEEEEYVEEEPEIPPSFSSTGQDFKVEIGGDITFPCQVENKGTFLLMFKRVLPNGDHRMLFVGDMNLKPSKRLSKSGDSFILQGVKRSHAGKYVCRIESSPAIEIVHSLDVQYPATVRRVSPAVQRVRHGASLTLECSADGNPPAAISWSRQQGTLPSGAQAEEGQSIHLQEVDRHVTGTYVCTASNGVGRPSSSTMSIQVEYPPQVTTKQASHHLAEGDKAHLECQVVGHPTPSVSWTRDGRPLTPDPRVVPYHGPLHHSLTISPVQEEDFGDYTCSAQNSLGQGERTLKLSGLPKKPVMTSSPAGGEETSYTLTWEAESPSLITMYRVEYRPRQYASGSPFQGEWKVRLQSTQALTVSSTSSSSSTPASFGPLYHLSYALRDLQPARDYEAMVSVENKYGWSSKSDVFNFYTRREVAVGRSASGCGGGALLSVAFLPLTVLLAASPLC